ncbi:hypothetical protein L1987_59759 [Smallanthus sonchifolius]|uniref:Uncharacterized protein n=1 Tax=Smallanthus sonchifolius TaxID=185202 RepID=A0ACB9D659_9ASTR|nr:hypothetical protein L1987_59759 [Smallanthus sonchifolius]
MHWGVRVASMSVLLGSSLDFGDKRMSATTFNGSVATIKTHGYIGNSALHQDFGNSSLQLTTKGFKIDLGLSGKKHYWSRKRGSCLIQASFSQATTVRDEVSTPDSIKVEPIKKSKAAALILIRHGESLWNENLFTGCVDVPLTRKGVEEAIEAGKRISNIPVDMIYTSALIRAQMTAMLAMTQHRRKKVKTGRGPRFRHHRTIWFGQE